LSNHLDPFEAFYQTASFWKGKLAGIQQFPLSNFDFSHRSSIDECLELPTIPAGTVLGKRVESFFKFCVGRSSNYELLIANEQIFRGKETIGEIDFIIQENSSGRVLHVELVYKFYIYEKGKSFQTAVLNPDQNQALSFYVGPNRRDYFIKKFEHLSTRQLPLLQETETQERLMELGIPIDSIQQQVCFLAHVFIPRESWRDHFAYLNKKCIVGYYMDEFAFAKAETDNTYFLPQKKQWPLKPQPLEPFLSHPEALNLAKASLKRGFAPLLWMQLPEGTFESFFVVAART